MLAVVDPPAIPALVAKDLQSPPVRPFLSKYIQLTKDEFIKESMVSCIGFTGAVSVVEDFYPKVSNEDRQKLISYVYRCMQNKKITEVKTWKEIQ